MIPKMTLQPMKLKKVLLLFILLLVSKSMLAQQTWSLEECITYAINNNLTIKDLEYNKKSNKENHRQAIRNLLPGISGYSDYGLRFGRSENPNTGTFVNSDFFYNNYSLNSSLDLFQGFQKLNAIKASKFLYKAAIKDIEQQKYLLAFRVMTAFYNIQFSEGLLAISIEQQAISKTNYELVKKQIELGLKAGADLYEAESLLLSDQLTVVQNKNNLQANRLTLLQEMNLEEPNGINIQPSLVKLDTKETTSLEQDSVFYMAKNFIPLIKAQELRTKAAKKNVAISKGNLSPSLSLNAGYGTGYYETNTNDDTGEIIPFRTQIKDNASRFVGVSLRIPISNKWSAHSRIKQQKIAHLQAKNNLSMQKQELYKTIQQLILDNNSLITELAQSNSQVQLQQLAFSIAQKKYKKGLITTLELFTAKNLFVDAQNKNLQVETRLKVNKSTLDFYMGLPVFNINDTY